MDSEFTITITNNGRVTNPTKVISIMLQLFFKSKSEIFGFLNLTKTDFLPPLYTVTDKTEPAQRKLLFWLIAIDYIQTASIRLVNEKDILDSIKSMVQYGMSFVDILVKLLNMDANLTNTSTNPNIGNASKDIEQIASQTRHTYDLKIQWNDFIKNQNIYHQMGLLLNNTVSEVEAVLSTYKCNTLYVAQIAELRKIDKNTRSFIEQNYNAILEMENINRYVADVYHFVQPRRSNSGFDHKSLCFHNGSRANPSIREFYCTYQSGVFYTTESEASLSPERMADFDRWCNVVNDVKHQVVDSLKRVLLLNRICYFSLTLDCSSPIINALIWATHVPFLSGLN